MCGIVGYAGFEGRPDLSGALSAILHRGPDGHDVEYIDNIALGNARLAIIDTSSRGDQPMYSADKSMCIVFNGEIYNFKELKHQLEAKYKFRSNSDTEVVLYAYIEWGAAGLQRLRGMFAFVIYDLKNKVVFGARDRLGQKPLKYYFSDGKLVFASEIKSILAFLGKKLDIDEKAIDDFLTLQYIPSPATGFKKLMKLPAAHYFVYKDGKLSTHRYWRLDFSEKHDLSDDDWMDLIYRELNDSVKSHLVSDVPVGALLSGGLDSSLVVALMTKNSKRKIDTFSIGFDEGKYDESEDAKEVSELYKTNHHQRIVTASDLMDNINVVSHHYDEPIADNSILPTMLVSKLTGSKVKVALTGDGGDENFAGYDRYNFVVLGGKMQKLHPILKSGYISISSLPYSVYKNKFTERLMRFSKTTDEVFYKKYLNYNCFFTNTAKRELYSKHFLNLVNKNDTFELYRELYDDGLTNLDNALLMDMNYYLPDDLLYKTDTASMAFGLELRSPFLDHLFMEKMATVPSLLKISNGNKKYILKKMALKYDLLPKRIVNKSKKGFNIPLGKWLKGPLSGYTSEVILGNNKMWEIFDKPKMEDYLKGYFKSQLGYDNNIFALLMLSQWLNAYS